MSVDSASFYGFFAEFCFLLGIPRYSIGRTAESGQNLAELGRAADSARGFGTLERRGDDWVLMEQGENLF